MRFERKPTPTADLVAVVAMVLAALVIVWAHVELYGIADIEAAFGGEAPPPTRAGNGRHAEALVRNRWVNGFTQ